jgi:hypothetical protein
MNLDEYFTPWIMKSSGSDKQFRKRVRQLTNLQHGWGSWLRTVNSITWTKRQSWIQNCHSKCPRKYRFCEEALTLDDSLSKAWSLEASNRQLCHLNELIMFGSRRNHDHHPQKHSQHKHRQVHAGNVGSRGHTKLVHAQHKWSKCAICQDVSDQITYQHTLIDATERT